MKAAEPFRMAEDDNDQAVRLGAVAVLAVGILVLGFIDVGPLTSHMIVHIASMNAAAPLAAVQLSRASRVRVSGALWTATVAQIGLLLVLHAPAVHHAAHASPLLLMAVQVCAFLVALAFWMSVVGEHSHRWQTILALMLNGKLACLLGALLIFAPRPLFAHHATGAASLLDQQMAGLLMLAACPLSYVLPAVFITARTIVRLEKARSPDGPRAHATAR
jgi:putative membrane protein